MWGEGRGCRQGEDSVWPVPCAALVCARPFIWNQRKRYKLGGIATADTYDVEKAERPESGSVESTRKVPTSHYHTKHAAVVSLGGCFCAKGSVESTHKVLYRPATTCTTQNTASHRTLEKMSAACTPFSLTFDRRHCHDQHVRIYRGGGLLRCARAASALSVRWPSERRPKTALSGPLRLRRARTSSRARAAPFRISSPSSASAAWIVCRDGRKLMVLGSINGQLLPP